jgi:hypothetical protein
MPTASAYFGSGPEADSCSATRRYSITSSGLLRRTEAAEYVEKNFEEAKR